MYQRRDSYPLSSELRVPTGPLNTALRLPKAFLKPLERTQTLHNRCGDTVEPDVIGVDARNLLGNALRVLAAALARMAARWGVLERSAVLTSLEVVLEEGQSLVMAK